MKKLSLLMVSMLAVVSCGSRFMPVVEMTSVEQERKECDVLRSCRTIELLRNSDSSVQIVRHWKDGPGGDGPIAAPVLLLNPGENSKKYFKDTAGFHVPRGCIATSASVLHPWKSGWHKIAIRQDLVISIKCNQDSI